MFINIQNFLFFTKQTSKNEKNSVAAALKAGNQKSTEVRKFYVTECLSQNTKI